jgi:hypothetical protein
MKKLSVWEKLTTKVGILESIDLTFGGAGNQIMRINGVRYATWLDFKEWPPIGARVRHKPYKDGDSRLGNMLATEILEILPNA